MNSITILAAPAEVIVEVNSYFPLPVGCAAMAPLEPPGTAYFSVKRLPVSTRLFSTLFLACSTMDVDTPAVMFTGIDRPFLPVTVASTGPGATRIGVKVPPTSTPSTRV